MSDSVDWQQQLYIEKSAAMLLYGRALGLSHSEAEDVLQDTFSALLKLESRPQQPVHYCLRSYRNRALNYKRSLWRRMVREVESSRWFEKSSGEEPREKEAMRCLEELPPPQREVIVLKIWHRYTFEEIGDFLEISANTAAGRYRYGIEKIRHCLTNLEHERPGEKISWLGASSTITEA